MDQSGSDGCGQYLDLGSFFPLYARNDIEEHKDWHFEGWSLLNVAAVDTSHATVGMLVTCNTYCNPELLADMARTLDHISGGRAILGLGAGWFEKDYTEYGYEFSSARERLKALESSLMRIKKRMGELTPGPVGELPILIGRGGETITLRLVAQHADSHNVLGSPQNFATKMAKLDEWCEKVGRDPKAIERTVLVETEEIELADQYLEAGADHLIWMAKAPFELSPLKRLMEIASS